MLTPDGLLRHAGRLLVGQPDEADARRAISACYYALFDLLIAAAAATQSSSSLLHDCTRRTVQHRDVRRVCDAMVVRPASRPLALQQLLVEPVAPGLIAVAGRFRGLQNARLTADYDLLGTVLPHDAVVLLAATQLAFDIWPALLPDPNTRTFLLALLFFDRWTRRT